MHFPSSIPNLAALLLAGILAGIAHAAAATTPDLAPVDAATRSHWMRVAKDALAPLTGSPCPFEAFGAAIVNHSAAAGTEGRLVCVGVNSIRSGNPTLHGEFASPHKQKGIWLVGMYWLDEGLSSHEDVVLVTGASPIDYAGASSASTDIYWSSLRV